MNWQDLITQYGYVAVIIGTFFEGETILVIAGFLAHQGYLGLPEVIGSAFVGTLFGDQLYFYIGRRKGMAFINQRPRWKAKTRRIFRMLARHQVLLILGFRFLYGIRTVTPFVLGAAGISPALYVPLNVMGALIWACGVGLLGFEFGNAVQLFLVQLHHYEKWIVIAMVLMALLFWLGYRWREKRRRANR